MDQIIRLVLAALSQSTSPTLQRPIGRVGWSVGLIFLVVLTSAAGMICLVAALWLVILPELGAVAATAVIGVVFLVIATGLYLGYRVNTAPRPIASSPIADALESTAEIERVLTQAISKNIGPIMIATVLAGLFAGLRKGR
jgi:hypothetical protein